MPKIYKLVTKATQCQPHTCIKPKKARSEGNLSLFQPYESICKQSISDSWVFDTVHGLTTWRQSQDARTFASSTGKKTSVNYIYIYKNQAAQKQGNRNGFCVFCGGLRAWQRLFSPFQTQNFRPDVCGK